jgi:hypothetical protein
MCLFILLLIRHYLYAPFYSFVFQPSTCPVSSSDYQSLLHDSLYFSACQSSTFHVYSSVSLTISTRSFLIFRLSVIIYMLVFIPLFFSHLQSLSLLLFIGHYLHVPLYFSVYQSSVFHVYSCFLYIIYMFLFCLSIYFFLFFCLLVIIYMFLFNLLFIGHYLHVPCAKVKNPRRYQEPVFTKNAPARHCQESAGFPNQTVCESQEKIFLPCMSAPALSSVNNLRKSEVYNFDDWCSE